MPSIQNVVLTEQELADLEAFLMTLTDPCVKDRQCLSPWIPAAAADPDDYLEQLDGVDRNGKTL